MNQRETVVLIHGVWMNGLELMWLGRCLKQQGFHCVYFNYPSIFGAYEKYLDTLRVFMDRHSSPVLHVVAHSMGGLLARQLFHRWPGQKPGRIVTLGTPHQGSAVARQLAGHSAWGRRLLGTAPSVGLLGDNLPPWQGQRELGCIAGEYHRGIGLLFFPELETPNDGTVSVREACLPEAADWLILPVSHTGLLFSKKVAWQAGAFLRNGRFTRPDTPMLNRFTACQPGEESSHGPGKIDNE